MNAGSVRAAPCRPIAFALGASAFALYVACLPPSFAFWDTGELQTVTAILGIAHPPACPAFVLLGWLFVHALPFGEPAWRVTLMCALAVSIATGLLFAVARRVGVPPVTAVIVTLGFAVASVTWRNATRTEIQDLALLFRVVALTFALRYVDRGKARDLFAMALSAGVAGATHGITLLLLPSLALCVAARRESRAPRALALLALGFALGLTPYAYLPLRSAAIAAAHADPSLALGFPPGAQPFYDYDHPATWPGFVRVVRAEDFHVSSGFSGFFDAIQYQRFAAAFVHQLESAYGYAGVGCVVLGSVVLLARRRPDAAALVLAGLLPIPYTESYRDLQDSDRYYLLTLWSSAVAAGVGFEYAADLFALQARSMGRFVAAGILVASLAGSSLQRGQYFTQRNDRAAAQYVSDIAALTPDNAIVVAEWAFATPLAYASYVQARFGRRSIVTAAPAQYAARYRGWLATRNVYVVTFDDALKLPGFDVQPRATTYYNAYRLALPRARGSK